MADDKQLAHLSAITALNDMMRKGTFYISTVREVGELLGTTPDDQAMQILRPLHCMKISAMPPELRDALPRLIERAIGAPAYQFQATAINARESAQVAAGTLRLLARA